MTKANIKKELTNIILFLLNIAIIIYVICFIGVNSCEVSKCYVDDGKRYAELASLYVAKVDMLEKNISLSANEISDSIKHINNSISKKHKIYLTKLIKIISKKSDKMLYEDRIIGAMMVALIESDIYKYANNKSKDELKLIFINKLRK